MDQLGLEDLEVDQRVDLLRTRTRGFNLRPQYYNWWQLQLDSKLLPAGDARGFSSPSFQNQALEVKQNFSRPSLALGKVHPMID